MGSIYRVASSQGLQNLRKEVDFFRKKIIQTEVLFGIFLEYVCSPPQWKVWIVRKQTEIWKLNKFLFGKMGLERNERILKTSFRFLREFEDWKEYENVQMEQQRSHTDLWSPDRQQNCSFINIINTAYFHLNPLVCIRIKSERRVYLILWTKNFFFDKSLLFLSNLQSGLRFWILFHRKVFLGWEQRNHENILKRFLAFDHFKQAFDDKLFDWLVSQVWIVQTFSDNQNSKPLKVLLVAYQPQNFLSKNQIWYYNISLETTLYRLKKMTYDMIPEKSQTLQYFLEQPTVSLFFLESWPTQKETLLSPPFKLAAWGSYSGVWESDKEISYDFRINRVKLNLIWFVSLHF